MSLWQTQNWQTMLQKSGQVEETICLDHVFIEKRSIGFGQYGLFVLGLDNEVGNDLLKKIELITQEKRCLFFQIETLDYYFESRLIVDIKKGYYKKFITPYTAVIDLTQSEDNILSKMKPKGRYNIKLARKKGVEVSRVEKTDENIESFYNLMKETTARDKFSGNSLEYYKTFLTDIPESELFLATVDGEVIAGGIFIFSASVSIYYYGASTSDKKYRNLMAPYLLQWEAIAYAKNTGSKLYDFLGVATPGEKNSSLAGVTDFKRKLTSDVRQVSDSYIWINKRFLYTMLIAFRWLKNFIK